MGLIFNIVGEFIASSHFIKVCWPSLESSRLVLTYVWNDFEYRNDTEQFQGLWLGNRIGTISEL